MDTEARGLEKLPRRFEVRDKVVIPLDVDDDPCGNFADVGPTTGRVCETTVVESGSDEFITNFPVRWDWPQPGNPDSAYSHPNYIRHADPKDAPTVTPPLPSKRPVVYITGPMTGLPEFNLPAFRAAKTRLVALGFDILSPSDLADTEGTDKPRVFYMRRDLEMLMQADAIFLLEGWSRSKGALLEFNVAQELGLLVIKEIGP